MANDGTKKITREDLLEDLRKTTTELRRTEAERKSTSKGFGEDIKSYKEHIAGILQQINELDKDKIAL